MKFAYQYIRISDEDQSNFSLSGQQKMNEDYAAKHDIKILKTFIDDGYSAKNFNRPQWKELEESLSKNKNKVDYLIVLKYDRLIRNAAEGLAFIEKLEQKWDVKLLSVMENFFIDPHSPFFFKMRADLLVSAEFERRVISDRTKFGVWSAKTQGRFIGVAPFGYKNARDEKDKPIIVLNKEQQPVIEQIFEDFLCDVPFPMIMSKIKKKGFNLKGHDALKRVLTNHVYGGLVLAPAYKDEVPKVVKGCHEGIVSEDIFWRAYYKLNDKIRPQVKSVDENIPLRGFLLCKTCGKAHTGGKSKGKRLYYYYYRCNTCKNENYSSNKVHKDISEILTKLSLKTHLIEALQKEAEQDLQKNIKERGFRLEKLTKEYEELKNKLDALEEKYISDKIEHSTYEKWHPIYKRDLTGKGSEMRELMKDESETHKLFNDNLKYLSDLNWIYKETDVEGKQALLKGIFPGCLTKEKEGYRTPFITPLFSENCLNINGLLRIEKVGNADFQPDFPTCTRDET